MKILNYKSITFLVLLLLGSATVFAQTRKTATEKVDKWTPWALRDITRNVTYTYSYIEVDGEKVYDGPFTFEARGINNANTYEKVTGSFSNGEKDGDWNWTVKMKDIFAPLAYTDGSFLTVDGTMVRHYKNGKADGEWSCSYVAKRRDKVYNEAQKKSVFGEYINNQEVNFSQKVIFKDNAFVDLDGIKFANGVLYGPDGKVLIDGVETKLSYEEYEEYVKSMQESKSAVWDYNICYADNACYTLSEEYVSAHKKLETELFKPDYFSEFCDLGDDKWCSYKVGVIRMPNISVIRHYEEYDTVAMNNYLKTHTSDEFYQEYYFRLYKPEQSEYVKELYHAKRQEDRAINEIRRYIKDEYSRDKFFDFFVIYLPQSCWYVGNHYDIPFLTPKFPSDWVIEQSKYNNSDYTRIVKNTRISNHLSSLSDSLERAKTLDDINIVKHSFEVLYQDYKNYEQSIENINNSVPKEINGLKVEYLLEKSSITPEQEKKYQMYQSDWHHIAIELMHEKPKTNVYTVIYYTFQYIHDNLQPSKYSTITDYCVDYYKKIQQLISYVNEHPRKASKKKTELELLEAAGIVL